MTSHTDGRSMILIAVIIFVIFGWSISAALHNVIVQKAIATERATTAVTKINVPAMSQSPLYTEADNISNRKPAVVNGITTTNATEILFSGYGTARGVDYTDNGKALMMPRENDVIIIKGYVTMTTSSGDKAYATFQELGHPMVEANNIIAIKASGTAFFDSKSTGKLGFLGNAVAIYKDIIYKNGTDIVTAWDWK
jgi:hypothetical protein